MKTIILYSSLLIASLDASSQPGKYFTASGEKCKNTKVYIDGRVQQYCGSVFTIEWTGACQDGYASGQGQLTINSKVPDRSFTMTYSGTLNKGKKEGKGTLNLFLFYASFAPYYTYTGSFRNDEFDGYGEFKADYPYPVDPEDFGKGISMESLGLELAIWRSDLFFYEYKGNFFNGKIADTENGTGKTKRMRNVAKAVRYTGAIKNGRPNGKGTASEETVQIYPNEQSYLSKSGNFVNGVINGYGKETGRYFEYEGEFVNGSRQGKGKMTHYEYVGAIEAARDNKKPGRQVLDIIDGDFKEGSANGFCTIYFQNAAAYKYTGPMVNGQMEGTGEIEFLNGSKLRGNFLDGAAEGNGVWIFNDGTRFEGTFKNNKATAGKLSYKDGSEYEGPVSSREETDKYTHEKISIIIRQGRGTMTDKDGRKKNVVCENDNCTESN